MAFGSLPSVLGSGGGVAISVIGGTGLFADGTAAAPSIAFANSTNMGFFRYGTNDLGVSVLGATSFIIGSGGTLYGANGTARLTLPASGSVGLVAAGTNQNITLTPSGTGIVTAATGFRITGTSAPLFLTAINGTDTVGVRLSGASNILNFAGGTVFPDVYEFYTASSVGLRIIAGGKTLIGTTTDSGALLQIGTNTTNGAGGMVFGTDTFLFRGGPNSLCSNASAGTGNTFEIYVGGVLNSSIGSNGTNTYVYSRVAGSSLYLGGSTTTALTLDASQHALFAGNVSLAAGKSILFGGGTISNIYSATDGVIVIANNANTGFTRLCFGPATASFPALRRTGAQLDAVVADNSGWANFAASSLIANSVAATVSAGQIAYGGTTATTVGAAGGASLLPATPLGYIIVNVGGTTAKVPYYNN